uniref:Uncharacterized protein n=1 Tax=Oryza glumipatula TaxID=40148 RepID=A0A0D9Y4D8_9ORYZ
MVQFSIKIDHKKHGKLGSENKTPNPHIFLINIDHERDVRDSPRVFPKKTEMGPAQLVYAML